MTDPTPRAQLPDLPPAIRSLTNVEARNLNARNRARFTPDRCLTCNGQRWFRWLDASRQHEVDYDCRCDDQYVLYRYLSHANIPLAYQRLGWGDLTHLADEVIAQTADYLDHQDAYVRAGFGMVIHGSRGNGKTLLAYLLVKQMIGSGVNVYATTFADMVSAFRDTFNDKDQQRWFAQTIRNAGVLYIDDVGREYKPDRYAEAALSEEEKARRAAREDNRPGSVRETMLEAVIRHRVSNAQPTIITTNFTPDQIHSGYGGHTMSLLGEKSVFVEATGIDRRQEMNRREMDYVRRGLTRPVVIS